MERHKILLIVILFLGAGLRFLDFPSTLYLGTDEDMAMKTAENSIRDIFLTHDIVREHIHPPLQYILINPVFYFYPEKSLEWARLISAIFGILCIFLTYKLGIRMFDINIAVLAAFFVSIAPLHVFYSQVARPYTLHTFFSLLSLIFLYEIIKNEDKKMWIGFIISSILNIYTHYFACIILFSEIVFILFLYNKQKDTLKKVGFCLTIILIFSIPSFYMLLESLKQPGAKTLGDPSITWVSYIFYKLSIGLRRTTLFDWKIITLLAAPIFSLTFLYGAGRYIRQNKEMGTLLLTYMFLPFFLAYGLSVLGMRIFFFRYFVVFLPVYFLFIANGILSIEKKEFKILLISGITILYIYILYDYFFLIDNKPGWPLLVGL